MNLGIGLGLTNYLRVPTVALDPNAAIAALFGSGEEGAWYDPSDSSTVWQDAAGTTPAGVGDPVGRIDDKSGNGNHATQTTSAARPILQQSGATPVLSGTELVTNGTFDTDTSGWTDEVNADSSWSSGELKVYAPGTSGSGAYQNFVTQSGKTYRFSVTSQSAAGLGSRFIVFPTTGSGGLLDISVGSALTTTTGVFTATSSITRIILASSTNIPGDRYYDNISVQEVTSWSGGLRYLDFDGVDDFLATAAFSSAQAQPNTIAVAAAASTVSGVFLVDAEQGGVGRHVIYNSGVELALFAGTAMVSSGDNDGNVAVWNALFNITSSYLRKNGAAVALSGPTVGTNNWSGITIGARNTAASNSNSNVYSFVGINRTLTAGEISDLESYLANKSGVTL